MVDLYKAVAGLSVWSGERHEELTLGDGSVEILEEKKVELRVAR